MNQRPSAESSFLSTKSWMQVEAGMPWEDGDQRGWRRERAASNTRGGEWSLG